MNPLFIPETIATPEIHFDLEQNQFLVKGCSRPEDVRDFYIPVLTWLDELKQLLTPEQKAQFADSPMLFKFKFDYFNSSSAKFILDILVIINNIHLSGVNMRIDWYYDENDDDMKEVGEELSEVVDFPFEYVIVKKNPSA
jgi:hypothetical protein